MAPGAFKMSQSQRRLRYMGRKSLVGLLLALLLGGLVAADRAGMFGRRPTPDIEKYDGKSFTVVKPVDGDTFDIDAPDGPHSHTRIRLWGVDTPETKMPKPGGGFYPPSFFGPEAGDFTKARTFGKTVRIELEKGKDTRDRTKGKRLLAWVYLPDGKLLNRELVTGGYGFADPRFDHHLKRKFSHLQAEAMNARRGLWVNGPPADMPDYYASGRYKLPK